MEPSQDPMKTIEYSGYLFKVRSTKSQGYIQYTCAYRKCNASLHVDKRDHSNIKVVKSHTCRNSSKSKVSVSTISDRHQSQSSFNLANSKPPSHVNDLSNDPPVIRGQDLPQRKQLGSIPIRQYPRSESTGSPTRTQTISDSRPQHQQRSSSPFD